MATVTSRYIPNSARTPLSIHTGKFTFSAAPKTIPELLISVDTGGRELFLFLKTVKNHEWIFHVFNIIILPHNPH